MRIKAGDAQATYAQVILDGESVRYCVEADSEEGWCDVIATHESGKPIIDGDAYRLERKHGAVVIVLSHDFAGVIS